MSEPRTQRSGVSGSAGRPLTPLRCVRGSDLLWQSDLVGDAGCDTIDNAVSPIVV